MKRITIGLVLLAFLAGPLQAQQKDKNEDNAMLRKYEEKQKENAEIDRRYQKTLEQTRGASTAPVEIDPWADMRGTDASKPKH
jgi:Ni/Co efflux regulator RcnB